MPASGIQANTWRASWNLAALDWMLLVAAKVHEQHACLSTAAACLAVVCAALTAAELSCAFLAGALLVAGESHAGRLRSQSHCQHPTPLSVPDCSCYHLTAAVGAAAAAAAAVAAAVPAAVAAVSAAATVAAAVAAAMAVLVA